MKRTWGLIGGILFGFCLFLMPACHPVLASADSLTVNIPDGQGAQVTRTTIKVNSAMDGSFTFTEKARSYEEVTIKKNGGNHKEYTVEADDDGNFSKMVKMASTTKKCKFTVKSEEGDRIVFIVTNQAYTKPIANNENSDKNPKEVTENESSSGPVEATSENANGKVETGDAGMMVVGNARSKVYHTSDQQSYRMNSANAVYFNSEAEAQAAGYRKSLR